MSNLMQPVEVKYIGKREPWFDRLYDTGLSFVCGQSRVLPWDMAPKFLRHIDLFEKVEAVVPADDKEKDSDDKDPAAKVDLEKHKTAEQSKDVETKPDDTQSLIEEQAAKNKEKDDKQFELQALYDQVNSMDKDAVEDFVKTKYNMDLDKRGNIDTVRGKAIAIIDEFGAV